MLTWQPHLNDPKDKSKQKPIKAKTSINCGSKHGQPCCVEIYPTSMEESKLARSLTKHLHVYMGA